MTFTEITESGQKTTEEKLMFLRKIRANLMDELHCKQQVVDQVDYMIYELKMQQKHVPDSHRESRM
ncbi:MAG: hypothetical protein LIP11_01565 [Clostridiales bacterium]|nr:hypothetical protein [Clostridiales bacterium]